MRPGIDPKVDYAFKRLFGREQNRLLLLDLLNAVLQLSEQNRLTDVQLLNPFGEKDTLDDKLSIVDVKARDQQGRLFDIEMQVLPERAFRSRVLYYWADLHRGQLSAGEPYSALRPTISVCLTNFVLFPRPADYHLRFELLNFAHGLRFSEDLLVVLLELPKFQRAVEQLNNPLDAWLYFLRHAEELDTEALPAALATPEFRQAMEELTMISQNDLERERYLARVKVERDELSRLVSAREEGQLVGAIHVCQRLLKRPLTPIEELLKLSLADMRQLSQQLEQELRSE